MDSRLDFITCIDFSQQSFTYPIVEKKKFDETKTVDPIIVDKKDIRILANIITLYCESIPEEDDDPVDDYFHLAGRKLNINVSDEQFPMLEFISALINIHIDTMVDDNQTVVQFETLLKLFIDGQDPELPQLQPEDLTVKLMYLGHHFDLWKVIDPFTMLSKDTDTYLKYQISSIVWPYIKITIGFIEHIGTLINHISM